MRQVVQLHTIEQWMAMNKEAQEMVLRALRVRERLWSFRLAKEQDKVSSKAAGWVPCKPCDKRGWIYRQPRKPGVHPSALGTTCLLKIYFETVGIEQQVMHEARLLLLFDLGTAAHNMLQDFGLAGAWGEQYRAEVNIGDTALAQELMIEGHADADNILIVDDIAGAPIFEVGIVHEYKTINNRGFEELRNRPMPKHKMQATIYSACLNRPIVVYLYMNKDNSNIQDFPIVFEPHIWEAMKVKAKAVRDAVWDGTKPPADVGYHCKECGYNYQCEPYQAALAAKKKG
jgi:CRISPR/Cas system-associated exonuclease Cas4 (RecB family)